MRPNLDQYFLRMAEVIASRATCLRRSVGCVLVNERGHVLSTGYNGPASGLPHCNTHIDEIDATDDLFTQRPVWEIPDHPYACKGAKAASGQFLDGCEAIHAEQNALLQCRDVFSIHTCYVTVSPCLQCVKLLSNTSCSRIVCSSVYAHDREAQKLWGKKPGRQWLLKP